MHDLTFFLLKNWLPVGVSAIVFFGIGLLFARAIWGRFNQRLANAIDENINLANQWSALGSSQQDLFKRLRVRWQADRDAYEATLAEKEIQIARLGEQLKAAGAEVPAFAAVPPEEVAALTRVRELEAALAGEKAESERLREELEKAAAPTVLPFALSPTTPAPESPGELQSRIRDLEQDLIDTHDLLHSVRGDYEKQVKLVESLEAKLIEAPAALEAPASVERSAAPEKPALPAPEIAQMRALLVQRGRELRRLRSASGHASKERIEALQAGLEALEAEVASVCSEREREGAAARGQRERLEARIAELSSELARSGERLAESLARIGELEVLARRKSTLQAELNDACHELYDVRRALKQRIETVRNLESRLAELSGTEEKNVALSAELAALREELAVALQAGALAASGREEALAEAGELRISLESSQSGAEAVTAQLRETRRELSDARIALAQRTEEYQKALAQMDELEAIIDDRSAEVSDLSAELRQQRDQMRQLRNTLAETQGELEALSEESRLLNAGARSRAAFLEEQRERIASLENALAERYRELNRIRVEADDRTRDAKHFASRATQLEAELERRGAEFTASHRRITTTEAALESANARIAELSGRLAETEQSLGELRDELGRVSRERDDALRNLERNSRRVSELEEAARSREIRLVEFERDLTEARATAASLEPQIGRLQAELESAREARRVSEQAIADLEQSLRAGDERVLALSAKLDGKEAEAAALVSEVAALQAAAVAREKSEAEAQARIAEVESELEARLTEFQREMETAAELRSREIRTHSEEIASLEERLRVEGAKLADEVGRREKQVAEIAALREKLAARVEEIRDLQNRIGEVMMQRSSRDMEIDLLKEKLKLVEAGERLPATPAMEKVPATPAKGAAESPYEAISAAVPSEEGIPLEEVPVQAVHHSPNPSEKGSEPRSAPEAVPPQTAPVETAAPEPTPSASAPGGDEDLILFFPESSAGLSRAESEKVGRCAREIRRYGKKIEVTVIGYAGPEGTPDFTESLSARRADAVRELLFERGVAPSVVKVRAAGQDRRFTDAKARRVEVVLSPAAVAETVN